MMGRLHEPVNVPIEANPIAGLKRLQQVASIAPEASIVRWGSYFSDAMKQALWRPDVFAPIHPTRTADHLKQRFHAARAASFLDRTLYVDQTEYLPGDLLVKADRATMAHSLEGRSPFLDHRLIEWASRLPERYKLRGGTHKYLLKRAFREHLPDSIVNRGKQGFGIPLGAWFRGPLADWSRTVLLDTGAQCHQWFQPAELHRIVTEHAAGTTDHGKRLWTLMMLELWLQRQAGRD